MRNLLLAERYHTAGAVFKETRSCFDRRRRGRYLENMLRENKLFSCGLLGCAGLLVLFALAQPLPAVEAASGSSRIEAESEESSSFVLESRHKRRVRNVKEMVKNFSALNAELNLLIQPIRYYLLGGGAVLIGLGFRSYQKSLLIAGGGVMLATISLPLLMLIGLVAFSLYVRRKKSEAF